MVSLYDLAGAHGGAATSPVNENTVLGGSGNGSGETDTNFHEGLEYWRNKGNADRHYSQGGVGSTTGDHMIELLYDRVDSDYTSQQYPSDAYYKSNEKDFDLESTTDGIGEAILFHGVDNPPIGDGGFQFGGEDLHISLLTSEVGNYTYNYNHPQNMLALGNVTPGSSPRANPRPPAEALFTGEADTDGVDFGNGAYTNPDSGQGFPSIA